jgi:toxin ParE1/3/4
MTWPVNWTPPAELALDGIIDHIAPENPAAARYVVAAIREHAEHLGVFPRLGRPGRVKGSRELVVPRLPYIIVYAPLTDRVDILHVYHGKRQWPKAF